MTNHTFTNPTKGATFDIQRAAEIVEGAFAPLTCVARPVNYDSQIEFEVSDGAKTVLKRTIPSDFAHKDYNLRTQIMGARRVIEEKGVKLVPWEMPSA
jgi:hypothetical protein